MCVHVRVRARARARVCVQNSVQSQSQEDGWGPEDLWGLRPRGVAAGRGYHQASARVGVCVCVCVCSRARLSVLAHRCWDRSIKMAAEMGGSTGRKSFCERVRACVRACVLACARV